MAWWNLGSRGEPERPPGVGDVRVALDGWTPMERSDRQAVWHGGDAGIVTLDVLDELDLAADPPPPALQAYFRKIAESMDGGLVEAERTSWRHGRAFAGIYKKPKGTGFFFTGFLYMPMPRASLVWAAANGERGMTGVREAIVTAQMFEREGMSVEWYEKNWAQDPYDPEYRACGRVDRHTLRYYSDDERFDAVLPGHPLSQVRATLRRLCAEVDVDTTAFGIARAAGA